VARKGHERPDGCRIGIYQAEYLSMEQQSVRKTYKYRLNSTPAQMQALEVVLWHCRRLYNVAIEQRKAWWERGQGKSATYYQQKAELPDLKAVCSEYAEVNAQVLQDVILRVERTFAAFFRRVQHGEKPGYPRFQGHNRYNSYTYPQYGGGAVLDGGVLSLSKISRIPIRLHRPLEGTPRPSPSVGKRTAGTPASRARKYRPCHCPPPGRRQVLMWASRSSSSPQMGRQ
jgi:helix-turn-helix protein